MAIYNVLVWANETGKFANDFIQKARLPFSINRIWILGNEMKIEDLKAVKSVENTGIQIVIDEDMFQDKRDTELFMLGKCAAERESESSLSELGLALYSPADKSVVEVAKKLGISVTTWSNLCSAKQSGTKAKKNVSKKPESVSKNSDTTVTEKPTKNTVKEKKVSKAVSTNLEENKPRTSSKAVNNDVSKILKSAKLPKQIANLLDDKKISEIEKAIARASDAEIGLPMLLSMFSGFSEEDAKEIAKALAPQFKILKEKLSNDL